ncbi:MAG: ribonuclease R [Gammaproteobacteria bacterium]|nr:ribonuclease R [Gammaproteobacteria bacterium]
MSKDPHQKREAARYENPIASRKHILSIMSDIDEPVGFKRLTKELELEEETQREALKKRLRAMVRDGQLVVDRRNVYAIASRMELVTGKVLAHADGFGFLSSENREEDIFLSNRQMRAVFHGDIAQVRIRGKDRRGRSEGEIVEVLERNTQQVVARLYYEGELNLLESLNNRIVHEILVQKLDRNKSRAGQIVVAQIIEQPSIHGIPTAEVIETLGDHLTPDMEVEVALRNNDIPFTFEEEVHHQVDQMPIEVEEEEKRNRKDLRALPFVTIDGEDARDFDDAVYCERKTRGGWRLFVAIADVAHYVEIDSPLDNSAFDRGTSVYFPQYVVPMLPEKLSNGLCSLKPGVDRLVLVCEMTISVRGRISGFQFYEGAIHSHGRLTYTEVTSILRGDSRVQDKYKNLCEHIDELNSLYLALQKSRDSRGALDFDSRELGFEFDAEGRVAVIEPRVRNDAHRLIEECMLCANVCAAKFIDKHGKPGLYRVHEPPEEEKVEGLIQFLASLGISFSREARISPRDYQLVLDQLRKRKNGHVMQLALLRSLNQAVYQVENKGHFGLNYPEYSHFTSPIRRFPDLMMHRLIKSVIHSKCESRMVKRFGQAKRKDWYPYSLEDVLVCGERSSFTERRAETAVYDVLEWMKCDYISDHVGDVCAGVITGVTKFGLFVELDDVFVEGLVHVSTLVGDYFHYDQASQCLIGGRTGTSYSLGDIVSVQVARVDVDERKVDFELVTHSPLSGRRFRAKDKRARKKGKRNRRRQSQKKNQRRR